LSNQEGPIHRNFDVPQEIIINSRISVYNTFYHDMGHVKENVEKLTENKDIYLSQIENIVATYGEPPKKNKKQRT